MNIDKINTLLRKAMRAKRNGGLGLIQNKHRRAITARVMTNVERPWNGREALTPNIGRDIT